MTYTPVWHVLGAGAIGCLLTYRLQQAKVAARLLTRRMPAGTYPVIDAETRTELHGVPTDSVTPGSISHLLLCTKAGDLPLALESVLPLLTPQVTLVTVANGLGFEQALKNLCPKRPLYRAVSTAAAYRSAPHEITLAAVGATRIGCIDDACESPAWFDSSLKRLAGWQWETDIRAAVGEKFSLNCVINPLTAVLHCRNGELLADHKPGPELTRLCAETEPVLRRLGLWQRGQTLLDAAAEVCRSTAGNRSSMLQDVLAGRATEIEYLNAELLRRAATLGTPLPENQALVARLRDTQI